MDPATLSMRERFAITLQAVITWCWERHRLRELVDYIHVHGIRDHPIGASYMLDDLIDRLILLVNQRIISRKAETYHISAIQETFTHHYLGSLLPITFKADHGFFKNLASLRRDRSCRYTVERRCRTINFCVKLSTAQLEIPSYHLRVGPIRTRGKVTILFRENLFEIQASVSLTEDDLLDQVNIDNVCLITIGHLKIRITGFGSLGGNRCAKKIVKHYLNKIQNDMREQIEIELRNGLQDIVNQLLL